MIFRLLPFFLLFLIPISCRNNNANLIESHVGKNDSIKISSFVESKNSLDYLFVASTMKRVYLAKSFDLFDTLDIATSDVDISPKENLIAYTDNQPIGRRIAVYNINTKEKHVLPIENEVYMGCFSPDGKYLALNFFTDNSNWTIIFYELKTGKISSIDCLSAKKDLYGPSFSANGKYFAAHDMETVYLFSFNDAKPSVLKTFDCETFCTDDNCGFSSASKFLPSNDGKTLVFSMGFYAERFDGECTRLRFFDGNTSKNITDTIISVNEYEMDSNGNIYYVGYNPDTNQDAIYLTDTFGKETTLIKHFPNEFIYGFGISK